MQRRNRPLRGPVPCFRPTRIAHHREVDGLILSVERSKDGTLAITVTLPFERYLEGIAEVPSSWPRAALEAQAIAARSYALAHDGVERCPGRNARHADLRNDLLSGLPRHAASRWRPAHRDDRADGLALAAEDTAGRFGASTEESGPGR